MRHFSLVANNAVCTFFYGLKCLVVSVARGSDAGVFCKYCIPILKGFLYYFSNRSHSYKWFFHEHFHFNRLTVKL